MIFDPLIDTNQSSNLTATSTNNSSNMPNNVLSAQTLIHMQHQQQLSSALIQHQSQLPANANMFYALQSAAFINFHLQQQQQQQQNKLSRLQQIQQQQQQQQLMISQNAHNPYFMELLARNTEIQGARSKNPDQLIKAQQFPGGGYANSKSTNNSTNCELNKNEATSDSSCKALKDNLEFSTLKFYKEVEQQSMNTKLSQTKSPNKQIQTETNGVNENIKSDESLRQSAKLLYSPLNCSKRPLLKFGMDSILGNNSSNSSSSSVQSTPSSSPCKKPCLGNLNNKTHKF